MHRKPKACVRQQRQVQQHVREQARTSEACAFFNLLTGPDLLDEVESMLPTHRERLFPPPRPCRCSLRRPWTRTAPARGP